MTRKEQKEFVRELSRSIADEICASIDQEKLPDNWDGHELRELLAQRCEDAASRTRLRRDRKAMREFRNTVLVRNL